MLPVPGPRATRRAAIGGVLAGATVLAGCDLDARPGESRSSSAPTSAGAAADPDSVLVDAVIAEVDELEALVAAAAASRPLLASDLAPFATLHRAHRGVLPERDAEPAVTAVAGTPKEVAEKVRLRELQGQARMADWSVAAESGALARLLASMSAGIAAHLAAARPGGSIF